MLNRSMLYRILYALVASNGREEVLFGSCGAASYEAFERSLPSNAFPELWFELPLLGEPWFDLHALAAKEDFDANMTFDARTTGGCPQAFEWFCAQEDGVRQLALSWDISSNIGSGELPLPAVQLLVGKTDTRVTCGFLNAVGRADAAPAYRTFVERLPEDWFACYAGVFPNRANHFLRVECIPERYLQKRYATDGNLLRAHLRQAGLSNINDTLVSRCQLMANTPFHLEFQFDVMPGGNLGTTFGASVRFAAPAHENKQGVFDPDGAAGTLMSAIESWGLADERWHLLADTAFATNVKRGEQSVMLWCFPAFIKLRWRDGRTLDAKAYLQADMQTE